MRFGKQCPPICPLFLVEIQVRNNIYKVPNGMSQLSLPNLALSWWLVA